MHNFIKLFAGTAAAKALGFLAMPLIARLVTPEDFGEFSIFAAVVSIVAPLLALRYVDAIPIPKSAIRATHLLTLALLLIAVNATLVLALAWLMLDVIAGIYSFIDWRFILLVYVAGIALAVYEALNLWAVRVRNYGAIARTQVSQALAGALSKVILSYFAIPMGLMLGQVAQNFTGITTLLKTQYAPFQNHRVKVAKRLLVGVAKNYSQYPRYRLASQMLLVVTQSLPVLMVGRVYGAYEAGQLGLAFSVVTVPVMMVVENVRKLYYGEAARLRVDRVGELLALTLSILAKMFLVALPICLTMYFVSEPVFVYVFGETWLLAGKLASIYSLYVFFLFVTGAFLDLLNVLDKQKIFLMVNAVRLVFVSVPFLFIAKGASLVCTMTTFVFLMSLLNFLVLAYLIGYLVLLRKRSGSSTES